MNSKKPSIIEAVNTDATHPIKLGQKKDPTICALTGKSIVQADANLEESRRKIEEAAKTPTGAKIRNWLNETNPKLN